MKTRSQCRCPACSQTFNPDDAGYVASVFPHSGKVAIKRNSPWIAGRDRSISPGATPICAFCANRAGTKTEKGKKVVRQLLANAYGNSNAERERVIR